MSTYPAIAARNTAPINGAVEQNPLAAKAINIVHTTYSNADRTACTIPPASSRGEILLNRSWSMRPG